MDLVATLKISAARVSVEHLRNGIVSPQNIPLALIVVAIIFLAEIMSQKNMSEPIAFVFLLTGSIFLFCSFYLPPVGESLEETSLLAYGALMAQLASVIVIALSTRPNLAKLFLGLILVVGIFTLSGFIYTFSNGETNSPGSENEAAVVLGASVWGKHKPSPILRARLDKAVNIYNSGRAKKIVVTGGTRRFDTIESEVQAWYLRQNGIPDSNIISEHITFCTSEQAEYIKRFIIDSLGMKNIVIVTDDWHLPRALLMCRWEGAKVYGTASDYRMLFTSEIYSRIRESAAIQVYLLFGA